MIFTAQTVCLTKNSVSAEKLMNIDIKNVQQYALARFNEQKKQTAKNKCFNCEQKKHLHRNCSTNLYNKIQQLITINLNMNTQIILIFKIYIMLVNDEMKLSNNF